ncbi:hypothetical protein NHQ30_005748 [Ciborinia camelliae]|nr:hypothetical protein NHQ30_005748 [Ciborinia camelliae]
MEEEDLFQPIKAVIADLKRKLAEKETELAFEKIRNQNLCALVFKRDMRIEELENAISKKDRIIAEKDLLLSDPDGDQKVTFHRHQELEIVVIKPGLWWLLNRGDDISKIVKVQKIPIEDMAQAISTQNFMINWLYERYHELKKMKLQLIEEKDQREFTYNLGLFVRARRMEHALAKSTKSVPRERTIVAGNHAAHGANAICDAHMVMKLDPEARTHTGGNTSKLNIYSGFRDHYEEMYLLSPETVSKWADDIKNYWKFLSLLDFYEGLRLWNSEGLVGCRYRFLRQRVKNLIDKLRFEDGYYDDNYLYLNEGASQEYHKLENIFRELLKAHRDHRMTQRGSSGHLTEA